MALIDDILSGLGFSSGNAATASNVLGGIATGGALQVPIENIRELRGDILGQASDYAARGQASSAFQPFAVTTPRGTAQVGAQGGLTLTPEEGLAPDIANLSMQQALSALQQQTPTAQGLFAQMQGIRAPEQQRQQLELEQRLFGQGRGGVQTAAYGGTPEQLALAKAQEEQRSSDLFSALQMAPQLAQQQVGLGSSLFGLGAQAQVQPMQGLLSALTPSLAAAQLAQSGRASEAELLGRLGPSALTSMYETGQTEAELQQVQLNALLKGLGLAQAPETTTGSVFEQMFGPGVNVTLSSGV